jgi:hypothetical protein
LPLAARPSEVGQISSTYDTSLQKGHRMTDNTIKMLFGLLQPWLEQP